MSESDHGLTDPAPREATPAAHWSHVLKFCGLSALGLFVFFVPVTFGGKSTIPLDHIVSGIRGGLPALMPWYALAIIAAGAVYPFVRGTWHRSPVDAVFSALKVLGLGVALMLVFEVGPQWLFAKDLGPFLFEKLVIAVGVLVPVGAIFLAFLVDFGLLESIGVLFRPIMKPIWGTPGRSAIDAVASFVGSYSIGLLITNRVYKESKYTAREATIIATGFSTVSATFMVIVAKTLDLMAIWTTYFAITLIITFLVTAITVRIPPISRKPERYVSGDGEPEQPHTGNLLVAAWREGIAASGRSPSVPASVAANFRDGVLMAMSILPTILSVGLIGLVLAKFTPVFDWVALLFYPLTAALQLPDAMLAAKAASVGIAEMFLPALVAVDASLPTRFVAGVVSVSSVLFFSASIPCILATEIPVRVWELVVLWFERTVLSILLATPVAYLIM
ncbi:YjiH family protein [Arhodomonas sp. AD133]|uniref:YjiH family protein n=1 Tax=Arhodomonas sp. AD133 TaxID=3415009 RepID=UPI003EBF06E2